MFLYTAGFNNGDIIYMIFELSNKIENKNARSDSSGKRFVVEVKMDLDVNKKWTAEF